MPPKLLPVFSKVPRHPPIGASLDHHVGWPLYEPTLDRFLLIFVDRTEGSCRDPDGNGVGRDIGNHHGSGANNGIPAYADIPKQNGVFTNDTVVLDDDGTKHLHVGYFMPKNPNTAIVRDESDPLSDSYVIPDLDQIRLRAEPVHVNAAAITYLGTLSAQVVRDREGIVLSNLESVANARNKRSEHTHEHGTHTKHVPCIDEDLIPHYSR